MSNDFTAKILLYVTTILNLLQRNRRGHRSLYWKYKY